LPGLGFVASSFGFYYPADLDTSLDGFNLDDRVSSSDSPAPVECVNDADQAALDALATEELSAAAVLGMIAADCPTSACVGEIGNVLSDGSEAARNALGDCIASCMTEQTGLSTGCTGCYGSIAACSTGCCLVPCAADPGSAECANCALENCIDVNACTGL
jgi:hypothetical protein